MEDHKQVYGHKVILGTASDFFKTCFSIGHISWAYLNKWLGLQQIGALEPKPGVPPTSGHLSSLISATKTQGTYAIISAAYQDQKPARWLQERTGVPVAVLPYSVGGDAQAKDLFGLFDSTIDKLLSAAE